jgi:hypothetical protein
MVMMMIMMVVVMVMVMMFVMLIVGSLTNRNANVTDNATGTHTHLDNGDDDDDDNDDGGDGDGDDVCDADGGELDESQRQRHRQRNRYTPHTFAARSDIIENTFHYMSLYAQQTLIMPFKFTVYRSLQTWTTPALLVRCLTSLASTTVPLQMGRESSQRQPVPTHTMPPCCLPSAVCCLLSAVCCLLSAVCCLLSAACCLLSAVCCLLSAVCCLLSAVKCSPYGVDNRAAATGERKTFATPAGKCLHFSKPIFTPCANYAHRLLTVYSIDLLYAITVLISIY